MKYSVNGKVFTYSLLDSTQDEAKRLFAKGVQLPFFVIAKKQTKGRGRFGRKWVSDEGGVWLTYALKPSENVNLLISNYAAAIVVKRMVEEYGINCRLRWPNDVFVKGAKICGIISEAEYYGDKPSFLAIGIGLNVENDVSIIQAPYPVTSMKNELKADIDSKEVGERLIQYLDDYFSRINKNQVIREYLSALHITGKRIRVRVDNSYVEGIAKGLDDEGLLIIDKGHNEVHLTDGELQDF